MQFILLRRQRVGIRGYYLQMIFGPTINTSRDLGPQGISLSIHCVQRVMPASTRTPQLLGHVKPVEHAQYVLRTHIRAWELQIVYHVSTASGIRIVRHANVWMDTRVVVMECAHLVVWVRGNPRTAPRLAYCVVWIHIRLNSLL